MKILTLTAMMVLLSFSVSIGDMNYECPKSKAGSEHGNRGARLWEAGNLDEAEKETRQAIKIDPNCSMWQQNLGVILKDKNKIEDANVAFLDSLQTDKYWCTSSKSESL